MGNTTSISGKLLRVALSVVMAFSLSLGYSITQAGVFPVPRTLSNPMRRPRQPISPPSA